MNIIQSGYHLFNYIMKVFWKTRKNLHVMQNDNSTIIKNLIQTPVFDL
jgi:hypothetical protein